MRKTLSILAIACSSIAVLAQTTYPCVVSENNTWKVSSYDAEAGVFNETSFDLGSQYTRNTFVKYAGQDQYAYATYDGTSSVVHVKNNVGGHFKTTRLYDHVLSLSYSEKKNKLVYLATSKVPNYYDFLTEDVSMTILDLDNNRSEKIKIPTFSIFVPTLPYVGAKSKVDNRGTTQSLSYSISLPTLDTDKSEFMFVAKDIPGFNRLVKMNLNTEKVRTISIKEDVLSLVYVPSLKKVKVLTFEVDSKATTSYFVGDLNSETGEITNKVLMTAFVQANSAETDGTIQFDEVRDVLIVSKKVGKDQTLFEIDGESNEVKSQQTLAKNSDIFIPQSAGRTGQYAIDFASLVSVYPNPTNSVVKVETKEGALVDHMVLTDATGKVLRNVSVQSGLSVNEIDISNVSQGIYYLKVSSGEDMHVEKIIKY